MQLSRDTTAAALLGAASGMRTFTPEAVLVARGRLSPGQQLGRAILVGAAWEIVADKLPFAPARVKPAPFLGRIASGAFCGRIVAGDAGALTAAAASAAATLIGYRARTRARRKLRSALLEDALAITAANLALSLSAE
jgi:uncharacterized membrane protein